MVEDGRMISSTNPATREILWRAQAASKEDVDNAVRRARASFDRWRKLSFDERARIMIEARDLILKGRNGITDTIVRETGKPKLEALIHDVHFSLDYLEYYAKNTERLLREERVNLGIAFRGQKAKVIFEPTGVVGIINSWNFPWLLCFRSMVPALMAGNSVVLKPSEHASQCGLLIGKILNDAGLPSGVLEVVCGDNLTGHHLVGSGIDRLVFTGSTSTGKNVLEAASGHLLPVVLELGGKDPAIVCSDADLDRASSGIIWSALLNAGQSCSAVERVYVVEDVVDEFIELISAKVGRLRVGNGMDPATDVGPLIGQFQLDTVVRHVEDARKKGAKIILGGDRIGDSLFYSPTIITDVRHDMLVMKEETFGPVIPIMKVADVDEAIRLANDTPYGLTASIWTGDKDKGLRIASKLKAGCICLNNRPIEVAPLPWGGIKQSGVGRTSSRYGLLNFVNIKCITIDTSKKPDEDHWYPYGKSKERYYQDLFDYVHSDLKCDLLKAGLKMINGPDKEK